MKILIELSSKIFDIRNLLAEKDKQGVIEPVNGCEYNFNRKIDALCFKTALARFLRTGTKENAFEVFFCYAEIFKTFGGYGNGIDALLNLLYDHESNAATLLMKHRDHYSHSVYVFALGLAIFMHNTKLRNAFAKKYGKENLYKKFLKAWGMSGLFHDIGYPYEISFLDVMEYGKKIDVNGCGKGLLASYSNLKELITLSHEETEKCGKFMPEGKNDLHSLFSAYMLKNFGEITSVLALDEKILNDCLTNRIVNATKFMDHGYFSAVLFMRKLLQTENFELDEMTLDAVMAMLLHNSFYKRTYKFEIKGKDYKQMPLKEQPLAYLLMLCDELQCWDRIPYGENSKKQELAWDMDLEVSDERIKATYYFEKGEGKDTKKIDGLYEDITQNVVNLSELVPSFEIANEIKIRDKKVYDHLSGGKFIDLRKIAESINESYCADFDGPEYEDKTKIDHMVQSFGKLTLEYKLSNVEQAKYYVRHLDSIGCFFSDKQLDYEEVKSFTEEEKEYLAEKEHIRWVNEKVEMGWKYGTGYKNKAERERQRIHKDIIPYCDLPKSEQDKDYRPIDRMIDKLSVYGIKVYRLNNKHDYVIGCTGHKDLVRIEAFDEEKVRGEVRTYLRSIGEKHNLKLYSGFADGADLLFVEEALKCGVEVIAVLPSPWKKYKREHADKGIKFMQLLGQASEVIIKLGYAEASRKIVESCDELFVLWDEKALPLMGADGKEINRGGTYDTLLIAKSLDKKIKPF